MKTRTERGRPGTEARHVPCRVIFQVDILCCAFKLSRENGVSYEGVGFVNVEQRVAITFCRLMRRRIKVADPRIYISCIRGVYMHIREEVVDDNNII